MQFVASTSSLGKSLPWAAIASLLLKQVQPSGSCSSLLSWYRHWCYGGGYLTKDLFCDHFVKRNTLTWKFLSIFGFIFEKRNSSHSQNNVRKSHIIFFTLKNPKLLKPFLLKDSITSMIEDVSLYIYNIILHISFVYIYTLVIINST